MSDSGIPTGRVRRAVPLARAGMRSVLGEAARFATRRRTSDRALDAHLRQAERYAEMLGGMKGAVMKLGQLLSFVDGADLVPEAYRDAYRQALAVLQDSAPPMPPDVVAAIIEEELGAPPDALFERFSTIPIAAASIGQVHAASLADGTELAIKVQYPGVADAIRADLANTDALVGIVQMARRLMPDPAPNVDPRPLVEEVRERVGEELDYRTELANQAMFADIYRDHPFIHVPEVVPELSTPRVLAMEMVDGRRWPAAVESPQDLRDQWGEVIVRFVYGSLYRERVFNADPHPGNYLFHEDGTVTFLDFGCVKRFSPETIQGLQSMDDAVLADDAERLLAAMQRLGYLLPGDGVDAHRLLDWYRPTYAPVLGDEPFTYTRAFAAEVVRRHYDPMNEWRDLTSRFAMPRDLLFLNRILVGLFSVLAGLGATMRWRRIQDEIRHGAPPATELGELDAEWRARRG